MYISIVNKNNFDCSKKGTIAFQGEKVAKKKKVIKDSAFQMGKDQREKYMKDVQN
jgi:hypothetical protein